MKKYTEDWTSENFPHWMDALKHMVDKKAVFLEIGSFEGRSTTWFLENILTHEEAKIVCVDPWDLKENPYANDFNMSQARENFSTNLKEHAEKVFAIQGYSTDVLCGLISGKYTEARPWFNAVYVDGDHSTHEVLKDAILGWELLLPHGIMIFDDYESGEFNDTIDKFPKMSIHSFLNAIHGQYNMISHGYQLMIQKL